MPVFWNVAPGGAIARVSLAGTVEPDQLAAFHEALAARPGLDRDVPALVNLASLDTSGGVDRARRLFEARRPLRRAPRAVAYVAPTIELQLMARYFLALADLAGILPEDRAALFDTPQAAEGWLSARLSAAAPRPAAVTAGGPTGRATAGGSPGSPAAGAAEPRSA